MYKQYFGLTENPFSITPDPRYVFMSGRHEDALGHLLFGVGDSGGFVMLTGEVGTGKTTLCRCLLERLPDEVDIALILNPRLDALELLAAVCDELGVGYAPEHVSSRKALVDRLNGHLLEAHAKGRRSVLIIDEAQNLHPDVLEQVRLLTNLETPTRKLLQIILVGQPELKEILSRDDMRQLSQRITARFHLDELNESEIAPYIRHRLSVAGADEDLFTDAAYREAYRLSGGVPRLINTICDRAMLAAYSRDKRKVEPALVTLAATEVLGVAEPPAKSSAKSRNGAAASPGSPEGHDREGGATAGWMSFAAVLLLGLGFALLDPLKLGLIPDPIRQQIDRHLQPIFGEVPNAAEPAAPTQAPPDEAAAPEVLTPAHPNDQPNAGEGDTSEPNTSEPNTSGPNTSGPSGGETTRSAWETLFALWGEAPGMDVALAPCDIAAGAGLACFRSSGLDSLAALDLPALLTVTDPDLGPATAVLTRLSDGSARLSINGRVTELPLDQFSNRWDGGFAVLWRPPPFHARDLKLGMQGQDVAWLRGRVAELSGMSLADTADPVYDLTLADQISKFQSAQGLPATGITGAETLIRMSAQLPALSRPRLNAGTDR